MQAINSPTQSQAKPIVRPIAHLLRPVTESQPGTVVSHLPNEDTSVSQEVAQTAITGYN